MIYEYNKYRAYGKTQALINIAEGFVLNKKQILFVVHNQSYIKSIEQRLLNCIGPEYKDYIEVISSSRLVTNRYDVILVDEGFSYAESYELLKEKAERENIDLYMYGTR